MTLISRKNKQQQQKNQPDIHLLSFSLPKTEEEHTIHNKEERARLMGKNNG